MDRCGLPLQVGARRSQGHQLHVGAAVTTDLSHGLTGEGVPSTGLLFRNLKPNSHISESLPLLFGIHLR